MTDKARSAELILKLYDLRREAVMREARNWFFTFSPESVEDIQRVAMGEQGGYFRMVTTYWDMACSFVNHGAIDAEMFADATGEQVFVFAKIQPFLEQLRAVGNPTYMQHLERADVRVVGRVGLADAGDALIGVQPHPGPVGRDALHADLLAESQRFHLGDLQRPDGLGQRGRGQ